MGISDWVMGEFLLHTIEFPVPFYSDGNFLFRIENENENGGKSMRISGVVAIFSAFLCYF